MLISFYMNQLHITSDFARDLQQILPAKPKKIFTLS